MPIATHSSPEGEAGISVEAVDKFIMPENLEDQDLAPDTIIERGRQLWPEIMRAIRNNAGGGVRYEGNMGWFPIPMMEVNAAGTKEKRMVPLAFLATRGCRHEVGAGGCTMCDYGRCSDVNRDDINVSLQRGVDEVFGVMDRYNADYKYSQGKFNINGIGSFFDDFEVPPEMRQKIFEMIATRKPEFKRGVRFMTETRFEYITEEKLKEMRGILGDDAEIEIGFGFESSDPLVREGVMHKNLPDDYRDKIALLKKYNIEVVGHVMFKPPFLTEREAVADAVDTTKFLYQELGCQDVIMMSMNSRGSTAVGALERDGLYQLPSVWGTLEVMKQLGPDLCKHTHFLGFSVAPESGARVAECCPGCQDAIFLKLLKFNGSAESYNGLMEAAASTDCDCKRNFAKRMEAKPLQPLAKRVVAGIDYLARKYAGGKRYKETPEAK